MPGDVPTKGTVVARDGHFFLRYGEEQQEIDPMLVGGVEVLKRLEGQEVELVTQATPWVVGVVKDKVRIVCYLLPPDFWGAIRGEPSSIPAAHEHVDLQVAQARIPRPVCYVPADWVIRGVEEQVRANLLKQFVAERIIAPDVYNRLVG